MTTDSSSFLRMVFLLASRLQAAAAPPGTADPDRGAPSSGAGRGGEGTRGGSLPGPRPWPAPLPRGTLRVFVSKYFFSLFVFRRPALFRRG